jgi:RHS repeat-associated protein
VAEYSSAGALLRRYVPGDGGDDPVVWYEGSGTADRRYLLKDERGSVIGWANGSAALGGAQAYGAYGEPQTWTGSRHAYTGQLGLPEAQLYYYKARVYDPMAGRFLQTDPAGLDAGMNLYAYVGGDPVNLVDPSGMASYMHQPIGDAGYYLGTAADRAPYMANVCDSNCMDQQFRMHGINAAWFEPPPEDCRGCVRTIVTEPARKKGYALSELLHTALDFIPGYGLFTCTSATCADANGNLNANGWWAAAGLIPAAGAETGVSKALVGPGGYFGKKTAKELSAIMTAKYGPARSLREGAETFFNPRTGRSFNIHTDPAHGPAHVDIRRRGIFGERKYPILGE